MEQEFETKDGQKIVINNEHKDGCADQLVKGCAVVAIIIILLSVFGVISLF